MQNTHNIQITQLNQQTVTKRQENTHKKLEFKNKECLSLSLKYFTGVAKTSNGIRFQIKIELMKKE